MEFLKSRDKITVVVAGLAILLVVVFFLPFLSFGFSSGGQSFSFSLSFSQLATGFDIVGLTLVSGDSTNFIMLLLPIAIILIEVFVKQYKFRNALNIALAGLYAYLLLYVAQTATNLMSEDMLSSLKSIEPTISPTFFCVCAVAIALAIVVLCIVDIVQNVKGIAGSSGGAKRRSDAASKPSSPQVACPNCGNMLPLTAKFCAKCGSRIHSEPKPTCQKCEEPLEPHAKFCAKCGAEVVIAEAACSECGEALEPNAKFCGKCGAKVPDQSAVA